MFRASSCPSSGATTTAVASSALPSELGDSSAVGRGRAGRPAGRKKNYTKTHGQKNIKFYLVTCIVVDQRRFGVTFWLHHSPSW
jgi:hypothetical protein